MHKFEVGDRFEVIGGFVGPDMKEGTILRILPHSGFLERPAEYEVLFGLKRPYITEPNLDRYIPRSTSTEWFHIEFFGFVPVFLNSYSPTAVVITRSREVSSSTTCSEVTRWDGLLGSIKDKTRAIRACQVPVW